MSAEPVHHRQSWRTPTFSVSSSVRAESRNMRARIPRATTAALQRREDAVTVFVSRHCGSRVSHQDRQLGIVVVNRDTIRREAVTQAIIRPYIDVE